MTLVRARSFSVLLVAAVAGCGSGDEPSTPTNATASPPASTAAPTSPADQPLRLGVLGDSYSNGEGVGIERAWPTAMARELTRHGMSTRVVANPSVTGATTSEMLSVGLGPLRTARPEVMTVMLGVNDQVQGRTTAQFAADVDRALTAAIRLVGEPRRVLAVDIPDYSVSPAGKQFGDPSAISDEIDTFNRALRARAARRGVRVVTIVDISRRLGASGISGDGLHPSAEQLAAWAARIEPVARSRWATIPTRRGR